MFQCRGYPIETESSYFFVMSHRLMIFSQFTRIIRRKMNENMDLLKQEVIPRSQLDKCLVVFPFFSTSINTSLGGDFKSFEKMISPTIGGRWTHFAVQYFPNGWFNHQPVPHRHLFGSKQVSKRHLWKSGPKRPSIVFRFSTSNMKTNGKAHLNIGLNMVTRQMNNYFCFEGFTFFWRVSESKPCLVILTQDWSVKHYTCFNNTHIHNNNRPINVLLCFWGVRLQPDLPKIPPICTNLFERFY